MPPNIEFPPYLSHLVSEALSPINESHDYAGSLATSEDVIPAVSVKDDDGHSHHDVEADDEQRPKTAVNENRDDNEHHVVRTVLRKLSSMVQSPEEFTIDEKRLRHALNDAGMYGFGLQGISVWIFDDDHDRLVAPPGGFWYHPTNTQKSEALEALTDESKSNNVAMTTVVPGTDLAGLLWLESSSHQHHLWRQHRDASVDHRAAHPTQLDQNAHSSEPLPRHDLELSPIASLTWRDLKSLVQDPDTAKGPRLALLEQAGLGQAAGVQFRVGVCTGLVVFFVQSGLDDDILTGAANVSYLRQSAQFIGAAAAMTEARRATLGQQLAKRHHHHHHHRKVTPTGLSNEERGEKLQNEDQEETSKDAVANEEQPPPFKDATACLALASKRIQVWLSKIKGGGLQIPPPLSLRQSLWTAFGIFCSLLILSSLNRYYKYLSDEEYFLIMGPFGALMTLQYGLTAAPASQPRNAVMGQAVAGAVSLAFTYIPETILPTWIRQAVGPAVAIATMVKLGFTHPPAGAHSVAYASGKYNFGFYALVVFSTFISIIPATLINNMSRKRQYPIYWGVPRIITKLVFREQTKTDDGKDS